MLIRYPFLFKFCRNAAVKKDIRAPWLYKLFKSRLGEHGGHREHGEHDENGKQQDDLKHYICDSTHSICQPDD